MISVVIPTCDRPAEYLLAAVDSVMAQTLPAGEIIIVDNGSRDAIVKAWPRGVVFYRLPPRIGPSRARNFGAAMAQGTHIAFLDDDDWWDADFLREAWAMLEREGARCVYGRKDRFRNSRVERYKCLTPETLSIEVLLHRNPGVGGQNLLIDKTLFWEVGGMRNDLRISEDKALAIDLLELGHTIVVAPEATAILREHDGDRARHMRVHKLLFVWRYRHLLGFRGLMASACEVFLRGLRNGWRASKVRARL